MKMDSFSLSILFLPEQQPPKQRLKLASNPAALYDALLPEQHPPKQGLKPGWSI